MDDVFIDGTNNTNNNAQEMLLPAQSRLRLKAYCVGNYFLSLFIKTFLMFLLLSLNFGLFVKAGTFDVFGESSMAPEISGILWMLFYVSLGVMFVLSFSCLLQNTALSIVAALFVFALLNQFALFDIYNFLSDTVKMYVNESWGNAISGYSHIAAAVLVFVLLFIYLIFAHNYNLAFLCAFLALLDAYVIFGNYWNDKPKDEFWKTDNAQPLVNNKGDKKFVHILLPNAAAYPYVAELSGKFESNKSLKDLKNIMLGFAEKNNFEVFPNAYVTDESEQENLAYLMNLGDKSEDDIIKAPLSNRSWDFSKLSRHLPQLKANKLAHVFDKGLYNISAYQSENMNLCTYHHDNNSQRCTSKISMPVMLDEFKNVEDKEKFILSQWLESTGLLSQNDEVSKTFKAMLEKAGLVSPSFGKLYIVHSLNVLDNLTQDILKDKGNTYYLVALDLPADVFVYNEFCMLEPQNQWISMKSTKSGVSEKYAAYAEQYSCLFGRLQKFMDDLNSSGKSKQNVIVLQGISPILDGNNKANSDVKVRFASQQNVWLAIRDSAINKFETDTKICSSAALVSDYLYRQKKCVPFADLYYTKEAQKTLQTLADFKFSAEEIARSQNFYKFWYKYWNKAQDDNASSESLVKELEKDVQEAEKNMSADGNKIETVLPIQNDEDKQVAPAPKVPDMIQEGEEVKVEPLFKKEAEPSITLTENKKEEKMEADKTLENEKPQETLDVEKKKSETKAPAPKLEKPQVQVKVNVETNVQREIAQ